VKGVKFLCLMEATIEGANSIQSPANSQSLFTDYSSLAANGWGPAKSYYPLLGDALAEALNAFGIELDVAGWSQTQIEAVVIRGGRD
jgi:hypothetical protein